MLYHFLTANHKPVFENSGKLAQIFLQQIVYNNHFVGIVIQHNLVMMENSSRQKV